VKNPIRRRRPGFAEPSYHEGSGEPQQLCSGSTSAAYQVPENVRFLEIHLPLSALGVGPTLGSARATLHRVGERIAPADRTNELEILG